MTSHPDPNVQTALSVPHIVPMPEGDPQQNPPDDPEAIKFISTKYTPEQELDAVVKSIKGYVDSFAEAPIEEQPTIAVLVPRNARGVDLVNALRQKGIGPIELISSTSETRAAGGSLNYLLSYLADPQSASKLANAYRVYRRDIFGSKNVGADRRSAQEEEGRPFIEQIPAMLRKMVDVENFIAPRKENDWLAAIGESEAEQVFRLSLDETLDCGEDTGTPVIENYHVPFKFTGELKKVTVYLKPVPLTAADQRKLDQSKVVIAVAQ